MGLFNFFRRKQSVGGTTATAQVQPIDTNRYLIRELKKKLEALGYKVEESPEYVALVVNKNIEIATAIIDVPGLHPLLMHVMVLTIHKYHFPMGIEENLVGMGETMEQKVETALNNYITTTLSPILESFTDNHNADLDFYTHVTGRDILWHPNPGPLIFQGHWDQQLEGEPLLDILQDELKIALEDKKFNWLKVYLSKTTDGSVVAECLLNNEVWEEGFAILHSYVETWQPTADFIGLKQFTMIRRCDGFDK